MAAIRRRSISAAKSGSTTSRARRIASRSRVSPRRRPNGPANRAAGRHRKYLSRIAGKGGEPRGGEPGQGFPAGKSSPFRVESNPIRPERGNRYAIRRERRISPHRLQSQQCNANPVARRPHFAGLLAVEHDDGTGFGRRAFDPYRKQPLLDETTVFGAGGQFLADIAAL